MKSYLAFLIISLILDVMLQTDTVQGGFNKQLSAEDTRIERSVRHRHKYGKVFCKGEDSFVQNGRCITLYSEKLTFYDALLKCKEEDSKIFSYSLILTANSTLNEEGEEWYWNNDMLHGSTFYAQPVSNLLNFNPVPDNRCLVTSTKKKQLYVPCLFKYPFACVSLYSNVLSTKVNDEVIFSDSHLKIKDGFLKIECLTNAVNNAINVYITKNNTEIARADNQSQVVYYVPLIRCDNAGSYKCKAEFPESGVTLRRFFSILLPCPISLTLSVNGERINNTKNLIVTVGTATLLGCSVENPEETYILFISKNVRLGVSSSVKYVTHNLTINGCKDSGAYTCHYESDYTRLSADMEFNVVVDNCSLQIISFKSGIAYEDYYPNTMQSYFFWNQPIIAKRQYTYLACNAETYSRPTNLAIRAYDGSILTSKQNVSRIEWRVFNTTCDNNGKVTCELTDYIVNQTYSVDTYIFMEGCPPKLCHEEDHWKHVEAALSKNVTISFCFMLDDTGRNVSQTQIFKNKEFVDLNDTNKYTFKIIASDEKETKRQLTFTIFDVDTNDLGNYSINLQTAGGMSITFSFTMDGAKYYPHGKHSIASAVTVILAVIILASAVYFSVQKKKLGVTCCPRKSDN